MMYFERVLKKIPLFVAGASLALSITACTTTNTVTASKSVQITYKVKPSGKKYASTSMPSHKSVPRQSGPQVYVPSISAPKVSRPAPRAQEYRPRLQQPQNSQMTQAPTPYSAPHNAQRPTYQAPRVSAALPTPIAPQAPRPVTPLAEQEAGGNVTMTIQGRIHLAGHSSSSTQPRFIQERLETK